MTTPKDIEAAEKLLAEVNVSEMGIDASKWASEFCRIATNLGHKNIDEGWMIGWFANAIEAAREEGRSERLKLSETNEIDGQEYPSDDLMRLVEKIMGVTEKECADDVETGSAAWEHATEILMHIKAAREARRDQIVNFLTKKGE